MRPVGSIVSLYYDARVFVEEGDVIRTPSGRQYRVVEARRQQKGKHAGRWHLKALVLDPTDDPGDVPVHLLVWYKR